jgi:hypothetical protein
MWTKLTLLGLADETKVEDTELDTGELDADEVEGTEDTDDKVEVRELSELEASSLSEMVT